MIASNRITTHQLPRIRHARQTSATPDTRGVQPNRLRATCARIDCMPPSLSTLSGSTMRAAAHTGGIPRNAAHAERGPTCMCVRRPRPLMRGCVWRHRGARARDACVPPSVGETELTPPPRGATPTSRSRRMPPGHRTARGAHTPERDVGRVGLPRSALQSRPRRG